MSQAVYTSSAYVYSVKLTCSLKEEKGLRRRRKKVVSRLITSQQHYEFCHFFHPEMLMCLKLHLKTRHHYSFDKHA